MKVKIALSYAYAAKAAYANHDLRLASRYWNKIYALNLPIEELFPVMNLFPDDAVYDITDYIKRRIYV